MSALRTEQTAIFGEVVIDRVYGSEAEARAEDYMYDAHVYRRNVFGGIEPVSYKVLARWTDFLHMEYCVVEARKHDERGMDQC